MRCLALAQVLRERGHQVAFVSRKHPSDLSDVVTGEGFDVLPISCDPTDLDADAQQTMTAVRSSTGAGEVNWVVADSYYLDHRWHRQVRQLGARIMVIDDLADRNYDCDMMLDQNDVSGDGRRYAGLVPAGCNLLLGPSFVLLRSAVLLARQPAAPEVTAPERLLIMFAGDDPTNQTLLTLNALALTPLSLERIDVVVSRHYRHFGLIAPVIRRFANAHAEQDPPQLCALIAGAHLCIGSAGTSAWERCYLGIPAVVLTVADNQHVVASAIDAAGAATYLGRAGEVSNDRLALAATSLWRDTQKRAAMSIAARRLVDGQGSIRVARAMEAA